MQCLLSIFWCTRISERVSSSCSSNNNIGTQQCLITSISQCNGSFFASIIFMEQANASFTSIPITKSTSTSIAKHPTPSRPRSLFAQQAAAAKSSTTKSDIIESCPSDTRVSIPNVHVTEFNYGENEASDEDNEELEHYNFSTNYSIDKRQIEQVSLVKHN